MSDPHELPVAEVYKGVEVYGLQSEARIIEARRQIDLVIAMADPHQLFEFAIDGRNAPESRLLAKHKALASLQTRQRAGFDPERLTASTIGIERVSTVLGRIMAHRQALAGGADWPDAWFSWRDERGGRNE